MAQVRGDVQLDLFGSLSANTQPIPLAQPVSEVAVIEEPVNVTMNADKGSPVSIEDAGAELVYNRRNRVKTAKKWSDIADMNDALKVKEATKGNFWTKPDYAQLIKDGMQPMVAHIVKQVYDSVSAKATIRAGNADESIQEYISALNRVEVGLMAWATDKDALRHWAAANARNAGAMLGRVVSLSSLTEKSVTLADYVYPNGWKEFRGELIAAGGNKLLGALQPGYEEIRRAMKALEKGWPEKREAWEVQGFRIVENPSVFIEKTASEQGAYYLGVDDVFISTFPSKDEAEAAKAEFKPVVLFNKRRLVNSFDTRDAAVEMARELARKDKGETVKEVGVKVTEVQRDGVARRMEGENISSERLMDEFGLKGVNFGNWMKTPSARAEAQLHLNHAFDSFHDLADILGLPPKAMSMNGMLGLAIGAQGSGSWAAHFVPGVNEINLTRTSGAGSLAHEWAHAVDHYYAVQAGLATTEEPFLTAHVGLPPEKHVREMVDGKMVSLTVPRFTGIRPEMVDVFKQLVDAMNKRPQVEDEAKAALDASLGKSVKNVNSWLKSFRRDFFGADTGLPDWAAKAEARATFDRIADGILVGDTGSGHIAVSKMVYISPAVAELRELYKSLHGRLYSLDQVKGLQANIDAMKFKMDQKVSSSEHVPQMVSTDYAKNARALDELKGGKPYYSTTLEKFARAFDAFVSDELETRAEKNSYLSHTGLVGPSVPAGEEREKINAGFKALVGEIKSRETERGVALFSRSSETQSIFDSRIDELFNGADINREGVVALDKSDLLDMLGIGKLPIHIAEAKVVASHEVHSLTRQHWKSVPEWLSNPAAVFDSETVVGRLVFIGPDLVNGSPVRLIVEPNTELGGFDVHLLVNAYDAQGKAPTKRWVESKLTRYVDKIKSRQFFATSGLQLPRVLQSVIGSSRKIYTESDLVKYRAINGQNSLGSDSRMAPISREEIDAEIERVKKSWLSMPVVTVVDSVDELPFNCPSNADGAYCDGRVYVVADNILNLKQLQKVMAHECVLHHSLESMLGDYGFSKLHHGIQQLKTAGDPTVSALAENIRSRYGVLDAESETKEIVARAGELCLDESGNVRVGFGFMKSVFAGVTSWLRDMGFKVPFSNVELQGIMHDAGKWIHRDRGLVNQSQRPALRADGLDGAVLNSVDGAVSASLSSTEFKVLNSIVAETQRGVGLERSLMDKYERSAAELLVNKGLVSKGTADTEQGNVQFIATAKGLACSLEEPGSELMQSGGISL